MKQAKIARYGMSSEPEFVDECLLQVLPKRGVY